MRADTSAPKPTPNYNPTQPRKYQRQRTAPPSQRLTKQEHTTCERQNIAKRHVGYLHFLHSVNSVLCSLLSFDVTLNPALPYVERTSCTSWVRYYIILLFLGMNHFKIGISKRNRNRVLRCDGGIGAAPRLAAPHRAADTDAPGGHLNQTPGEGACVSHVAACAVLGPPAPSKDPHNFGVPAEGRADRAAGTRAPGRHLT